MTELLNVEFNMSDIGKVFLYQSQHFSMYNEDTEFYRDISDRETESE